MAKRLPPPTSDDAVDWIRWLDAVSCTGYVDVKIPGASVAELINALAAPAALERGETFVALLTMDLNGGPLRAGTSPDARKILGAYLEVFQSDLVAIEKVLPASSPGEPHG